MTTPLISFLLDGTLQGTGWIDTSTAMKTGAVRFDKGMAYVEDGTTNLFTNPTIETNAAGWVANGSTISRDEAFSYNGDASLRVVTVGTETTGFRSGDYVATQGQTFTTSMYLRGEGSVRITFSERNAGFGAIGSAEGSEITLTDDWVRHDFAHTMAQALTAYLRVYVRSTVASVATFWADALQLEEKSYASPFCPAYDSLGAIQPGSQWTGTAHASTSTRTAGELTIPCPQQPSSIALRYSEDGVTYRTIYSASLGQVIGSHGSIAWSSGALRITTSRRLWVDRVFAYDVPLNPKEQGHLRSSIEVGRANRDTLEPNQTVYITPMWWLYQ